MACIDFDLHTSAKIRGFAGLCQIVDPTVQVDEGVKCSELRNELQQWQQVRVKTDYRWAARWQERQKLNLIFWLPYLFLLTLLFSPTVAL